LSRQYLITNLVIIINSHANNLLFFSVGYVWDVEEHVASKYYPAWRGFKDCVIGRANGPYRIIKEDIDIIEGVLTWSYQAQLWHNIYVWT
jgi:hypothetical protein